MSTKKKGKGKGKKEKGRGKRKKEKGQRKKGKEDEKRYLKLKEKETPPKILILLNSFENVKTTEWKSITRC